MPYSNGILGWRGEIATSEREVEQPEPAFLFTRELFHNNDKIVKFAPHQKDAVTSDPLHFAISNNEIVVNQSGIYEIRFIESLKSDKNTSMILFHKSQMGVANQ